MEAAAEGIGFQAPAVADNPSVSVCSASGEEGFISLTGEEDADLAGELSDPPLLDLDLDLDLLKSAEADLDVDLLPPFLGDLDLFLIGTGEFDFD